MLCIPCSLCFPGTSLFILLHQFHPLSRIPSFSILSLSFTLQKFLFLSTSSSSPCSYLYVCSRPFLGIVSLGCFQFLYLLCNLSQCHFQPTTLFRLNVLPDPGDSSLLSLYWSLSSIWPGLITTPLLGTTSSLFFCDYIFSLFPSPPLWSLFLNHLCRLLFSLNSKFWCFPTSVLNSLFLVSFFPL